jgi:multidrug efflux system membrane fusion protein
VQPGSLIAQLDPRPYQAALEQAKANLQRDQVAAVAELQAAIVSDQAAIDNAQTQLRYTTIAAPIKANSPRLH